MEKAAAEKVAAEKEAEEKEAEEKEALSNRRTRSLFDHSDHSRRSRY